MNATLTKQRSVAFLLLIALLSVLSFSFLGSVVQLHATPTPTPTPVAGDSSTTGGVDNSVSIDANGKLTFSGNLSEANSGSGSESINKIIVKYRVFIAGFTGICFVSMILFITFLFTKLAATASNSRARAEVITGLIVAFIAAAGLGAVTVLIGFFYRIFL